MIPAIDSGLGAPKDDRLVQEHGRTGLRGEMNPVVEDDQGGISPKRTATPSRTGWVGLPAGIRRIDADQLQVSGAAPRLQTHGRDGSS